MIEKILLKLNSFIEAFLQEISPNIKKKQTIVKCKCLSGNTFIGTPNGSLNIKDIRSHATVWTLDKLGNKKSAVALKVGKVRAPSTHKMVHIILDDGRELFASEGHPTIDGRTLEDLKSGQVIDNARIKSVEIVPYDQAYTYDLLPSGVTGFYFANGISVGSTLKQNN